MIPNKTRKVIISIVRAETPIGNHTGAIHGFGIRKRTSMVVNLGGHLIKI
jgi:hypothetical protein